MQREVKNLFDNYNLLRFDMVFETELYLQKNKDKFKTKSEKLKALTEHLNHKYKSQSETLLSEQLGLINRKSTKDI